MHATPDEASNVAPLLGLVTLGVGARGAPLLMSPLALMLTILEDDHASLALVAEVAAHIPVPYREWPHVPRRERLRLIDRCLTLLERRADREEDDWSRKDRALRRLARHVAHDAVRAARLAALVEPASRSV